jgi:hypothetical protein
LTWSLFLAEIYNISLFILYVDCEECRQVYSKFVSASQTFDSQEITFGGIQHVGLAENLDVEFSNEIKNESYDWILFLQLFFLSDPV